MILPYSVLEVATANSCPHGSSWGVPQSVATLVASSGRRAQAKLQLRAAGYSFAAAVRKRPSLSLPISKVSGLLSPGMVHAASAAGRSQFEKSNVVGLMPAGAPKRHCSIVVLRKRAPGRRSSIFTRARRQILAISSAKGTAGCSRKVAPPRSATKQAKNIPLRRRMLPVKTCANSGMVRWSSPHRESACRKGRGPRSGAPCSSTCWWCLAEVHVSQGGPWSRPSTRPAWAISIRKCHSFVSWISSVASAAVSMEITRMYKDGNSAITFSTCSWKSEARLLPEYRCST